MRTRRSEKLKDLDSIADYRMERDGVSMIEYLLSRLDLTLHLRSLSLTKYNSSRENCIDLE